MRTVRLVGGIFLAIGLVVLSVGGYCFWSTQNFLNTGLRSTGTVVELSKPQANRYYTPVVQFETADHRTIKAVTKTGSNPPTHNVGDSVTVIYSADAPEDIWLNEPLELWFLTWMFGGLGSIFTMIGGGMIIYSICRHRVPKQ